MSPLEESNSIILEETHVQYKKSLLNLRNSSQDNKNHDNINDKNSTRYILKKTNYLKNKINFK